MKIVIIRTSSVFPAGHVTSMSAVPDIGTAYLSAYLKKQGHDVNLIDSQGEGIEQLFKLNRTNLLIHGLSSSQILCKVPQDTEIILVSCMHSNRWIYDKKIISSLSREFSNAKIIVGGEHATACSEYILNSCEEIYSVVRGEGEETLRELINRIDKKMGEPRKEVRGISYIEDSRIIHNEDRDRIVDLDSLPNPDWSDVPLEKYLSRNFGVNSMYYRSLPIITSRGCPFKCNFCTNNTMWKSKWFGRSVDSVVSEIVDLKSKYEINHVDIIDLTLSANLAWQEEFAKKLISRNVDIMWSLPIGTRTEGLTSDLLNLLRKSGLQRVLYASETGSSKTAKKIGKELVLSDFYDVLKWTCKENIVVKITLILGFPEQTVKELLESFKLIFKAAFSGVNDIVCLCFVPYPNTSFYNDLDVKYDYEDYNENININNDIKNMKSWSTHYSSSILKIGVIFFTLLFYLIQFLLRPWRALIALYRVFILKRPLTNFESIIYNIFNRTKCSVGVVYD